MVALRQPKAANGGELQPETKKRSTVIVAFTLLGTTKRIVTLGGISQELNKRGCVLLAKTRVRQMGNFW